MGGIYAITNIVNSKSYIGSAINFHSRKTNHFAALRKGNHPNSLLQRAFNKYGADCFVWRIIETVSDKSILLKREQYWIDSCKSALRTNGYNLAPTAGSSYGRKLSEESKAKIRAKAIGRKQSLEQRRKSSQSRTGLKRNPDAVKRTAEANRGKIRSEETRKRIGLSGQKAVLKINSTGEVVERYDSIRLAGKACNISPNCIGNVLRGKGQSAAGFFWKFAPERPQQIFRLLDKEHRWTGYFPVLVERRDRS